MYEQAIEAYASLVGRWLPTLAGRLEHWVLLPARIVGHVEPGDRSQGDFVPHLNGYIEPLSAAATSQVDVRVGPPFDWSIGDALYSDQRAMRPEAARWISGTIGGMVFEVGGRYPVGDIVYDWLVRDLSRLGLTSRVVGRTWEGRAVWDDAHD